MKTYEAVCIFDPAVAAEKVDSIIAKIQSKIESLGGKVDRIDKWGTKKLTISPKKNKNLKEGQYVVVYFSSDTSVPAQVRSILEVTEDIVRFIVSVSKGLPEEIKEEPAAAPAEEKVEISSSMLSA